MPCRHDSQSCRCCVLCKQGVTSPLLLLTLQVMLYTLSIIRPGNYHSHFVNEKAEAERTQTIWPILQGNGGTDFLCFALLVGDAPFPTFFIVFGLLLVCGGRRLAFAVKVFFYESWKPSKHDFLWTCPLKLKPENLDTINVTGICKH